MAVNDGSANAPTGSPQLPQLLSSYETRPSWEVAGVDYAVGIPTGTVLKNPLNINMAGVSVDTTNHLIRVTGNNVTLDGYNFTGWSVYVNSGAQNTTIEHSYFYGGSGIYADPSTSNVSILYNKFDGGTATDFSSFITVSGSGAKTIEYNWMENSAQHFVEFNNGGTVNYSYNLIMNGGCAPGAHLNVSQFQGGTYANAVISYNTIYQTPQAAGGELIQLADSGNSISMPNALIANNTMIAVPDGSGNPSVSAMMHIDTEASGSVQNNYVADPGGGAYYVFYPGGGTHMTYSGNIDMATGKTVSSSNTETATAGTPPPPPAATPPAAPVIDHFSPDTGVAGDGITDANKLTLTGTAAPNSTIKVYDGSTQIGTTTSSSTGSWDYITSILTDAKHMLTATATSAGGQTSAASAALAVTVDTVAPAAPVLTSDTVTSTNHVAVSGTAAANSSITVYDGTTVVGTGTASSTGAFNITTSALATGTHALTAKATDVAGNVSAASQAIDPVIPGSSASTPPTAPQITAFSPDSGTTGDHTTNHNTLTLTGTAAANSTVKVFDGTTQVGTATANSSGQWTLTTSALNDGAHHLTATDTNSSGTSTASAALSVTIDTHAPAAPVLASNSITNTNHVVVSGTAEANSSITVYDGTTAVGTGTTNSTGAFSVTTSALATGTHALTATATDVAGNVSAASQPVDPVISGGSTSTPPTAPQITAFSPDSGTTGDHTTNDHTPTLTGTAAANSTVKVFDGTTQVGTATANSSGHWTLTTSALSDGTHSLTATDTNASGQTSTVSSALSVTIDTHAPAAPSLSKDVIVNNNHVVVSGTAEANSSVTVYDGTTVVGTGTTSSTGTFSVTTTALTKGDHALTATATDAAGNVSAISKPLDPVIGSTAPNAPTISSLSHNSGAAGNHITNDSTLTLTGTAVADSTVALFDGTTHIGTATANSSGQWTLTTSALSDGTHNLTATDTDSSGQTSAASAAFAVTVDTHAPTAPTLAAYSQDGSAVGHTTALTDLVLKGTAEANSTIDVFDGGHQIGTATTNSTGAWNYDTGHLANGSHSFTAKAIDVAGNTGTASAADGVTVTGSTAPIDSTHGHGHWHHTVNGTADASSTSSPGSVTTSANGTWSFAAHHFSDHVHTFKAHVVDTTGQVTATSSATATPSSSHDTLTSSTGHDLPVGNGHSDTFVFAPNFGHDVSQNSISGGTGHDTIQFSHTAFDSFASVLSHASQVAQASHDVAIAAGSDALTLKNAKLGALNHHDFHFA